MTEEKAHDSHAEGIMNYLHDYLRIRERQAVRMNPRIANVIGDMVWQQMENLRALLLKSKSFGPERYRVADILAGADDLKRRALFSLSDQNSILYEIVDRADDQQRRVAELDIHDMRSLFRAIDPSLERIVQLIQHWIFWDLPDAADLYQFDVQLERYAAVRVGELPEEVRARYTTVLRKAPGQEVSTSEVVLFEVKRLEGILNRFVARRVEEEAYMMIIQRDEQAEGAADQPYDYKKAQAVRLKERFAAESQSAGDEAPSA
jgi:hypothetical protein